MHRILVAALWVLSATHCDTARPSKAGSLEEPKVNADAQTLQRIEQVDPVHAGTIKENLAATTFTRQPLGFYKRFQLVTVEVRLPHRALRFKYADDGKSAVNLTPATPEALYKVNQEEALTLEAAEIPAYLRFFVENTEGGKRRLVERAEDVQWLPATNTDPTLTAQKDAAAAKLHPIQVTDGEEGFKASAVVLVGNQLLACDFVIRKSGKVQLAKQQAVADALPVPFAR
ncbi:hypothetical protein D7X12_21990 [Corallococcus sicarius]|uniref:Uncharacterized protein n=1 Tax=Corallococcus sicarius TaxID=2316726 RepID=A0A3A8NFQ0_9BACT|nr:hypothetical protein D7X12_21990 [Corallococcus sicarius]